MSVSDEHLGKHNFLCAQLQQDGFSGAEVLVICKLACAQPPARRVCKGDAYGARALGITQQQGGRHWHICHVHIAEELLLKRTQLPW